MLRTPFGTVEYSPSRRQRAAAKGNLIAWEGAQSAHTQLIARFDYCVYSNTRSTIDSRRPQSSELRAEPVATRLESSTFELRFRPLVRIWLFNSLFASRLADWLCRGRRSGPSPSLSRRSAIAARSVTQLRALCSVPVCRASRVEARRLWGQARRPLCGPSRRLLARPASPFICGARALPTSRRARTSLPFAFYFEWAPDHRAPSS